MEDYRLVYASCSNLSGEPAEVAQAVQELVASSRAANAKRDVTGMLLFSGNHFAQILEGSTDALIELYSHIRADSRHHDVFTLSFEPVEQREFGDWAMAIRGLSDKSLTDLSSEIAHDPVLTPTAAGGNIVRFLEFLLSNKEKELRTLTAVAKSATDAKMRDRALAISSHTLALD